MTKTTFPKCDLCYGEFFGLQMWYVVMMVWLYTLWPFRYLAIFISDSPSEYFHTFYFQCVLYLAPFLGAINNLIRQWLFNRSGNIINRFVEPHITEYLSTLYLILFKTSKRSQFSQSLSRPLNDANRHFICILYGVDNLFKSNNKKIIWSWQNSYASKMLYVLILYNENFNYRRIRSK